MFQKLTIHDLYGERVLLVLDFKLYMPIDLYAKIG